MLHFWNIFLGFSTTYLYNIDIVFIKCVSKCFLVSCNNVILHKGYIFTSNETIFARKCLMNFQKLLLMFIPFSVVLFKCFFKDFLRNDMHMFLCLFTTSRNLFEINEWLLSEFSPSSLISTLCKSLRKTFSSNLF